MGTWRNHDTDAEYTKYNGNIWWWLRSPGDVSDFAAGWMVVAGLAGMAVMSSMVVAVCGPLCI